MNKWVIILVAVTLAIGASTGAVFDLADRGDTHPELDSQGITDGPPGDQVTIRSDEDIDPTDYGLEVEPGGGIGSGAGPIIGVGPGLSIGEALASNLTGPLLINGLLHAQNGQVRLCENLAESFPPQCAGKFLVVNGLDLTSMEGLTSEGSVTWSDQLVQVLGSVEAAVLTVAVTSQ